MKLPNHPNDGTLLRPLLCLLLVLLLSASSASASASAHARAHAAGHADTPPQEADVVPGPGPGPAARTPAGPGSGPRAAGEPPQELERRWTTSTDGTLICGNFHTGSRPTAAGLLTDLDLGAGGKIARKDFTIGAGQCNRVHCWDTTGVYVCNDNTRSLTINGNTIWNHANAVFKNCCTLEKWMPGNHPGLSGQKFIRQDGRHYNVIIGYANCNASPSIRPSDAGGGGVNNQCKNWPGPPDSVA